MTLLKESYLCHLLSLLLAAYEDSGLHRLALRLGAPLPPEVTPPMQALILALALFFSFPLASRIREALEDFRPGGVDLPLLWDILYALALVGIGLLSCTYLVKETYNPFIYFRF